MSCLGYITRSAFIVGNERVLLIIQFRVRRSGWCCCRLNFLPVIKSPTNAIGLFHALNELDWVESWLAWLSSWKNQDHDGLFIVLKKVVRITQQFPCPCVLWPWSLLPPAHFLLLVQHRLLTAHAPPSLARASYRAFIISCCWYNAAPYVKYINWEIYHLNTQFPLPRCRFSSSSLFFPAHLVARGLVDLYSLFSPQVLLIFVLASTFLSASSVHKEIIFSWKLPNCG